MDGFLWRWSGQPGSSAILHIPGRESHSDCEEVGRECSPLGRTGRHACMDQDMSCLVSPGVHSSVQFSSLFASVLSFCIHFGLVSNLKIYSISKMKERIFKTCWKITSFMCWLHVSETRPKREKIRWICQRNTSQKTRSESSDSGS